MRNTEAFTKEYEFRTSAKNLYHYLHTPEGLAEWFAEKVTTLPKNTDVFLFEWKNEEYYAKLTAKKINKFVRFDFIEEVETLQTNDNFMELTINSSEITNHVFLEVKDFYQQESHEDLEELWDWLISKLKEKTGG